VFISREYDYALRTLRALTKKEQLTVKEICLIEHIPQAFSYKILKKLEKAFIVRIHRGALGGYQLIPQPHAITLYEVYTAIEGGLYINECMQKDYACLHNEGGRHCTIHKELCRMQNDFIQSLRERSLADILKG